MKAIQINKTDLFNGDFPYKYTHAVRIGFDAFSSVRCLYYVGSERAIAQIVEVLSTLPFVRRCHVADIDNLDKLFY